MRRYFIKTYGCQMNIADSEKLADVLESAGYRKAQAEAQADIILVNTCVVRQKAEDRAAGYISSIKSYKEKKPHLKIGVCGCLVSEPGREVEKIFPHVDIFIAPNQPERLINFLIVNQSTCQRQADRPTGRQEDTLTKHITIMHGCDNFCSYCIVPYVRGREYSRPIEEILNEISQIDLEKHPEIFLLGQNVNSYKYGLDRLLGEIEERIRNRNRSRIRFMTSHPRDMSDDIINAVAKLPHVCEYFHLPIQHGDDAILKSMNRGYTVDYYIKLVDRIRSKIPEAAITSDVIVGYPGETDQQFRNTLKVIEEVGFDACNTATYSIRPATAAAKLADDVPQDVKHQRLQEAMKVVEDVARKQNEKLNGTVQEVLVNQSTCQPVNLSTSQPVNLSKTGRQADRPTGGQADRPTGRQVDRKTGRQVDRKTFQGRTRTNKIVKFGSTENNLPGKLVNVRINSAQSWVLKARLHPPSADFGGRGELINGKF